MGQPVPASSDEIYFDKLNAIRDEYAECKIETKELRTRLQSECGIVKEADLDYEQLLAEDSRYEYKLEQARKEKTNEDK